MMTDDTVKRASFGFDADFGDLSTVKPTGAPKVTPKPQAQSKPVTKPKALKKEPKAKRAKPPVRKAQDSLADRLAKSQGFTSREAGATAPVLMKKRRRVQHDEPVDQLSIRGPVRVLNGFIDYCEAHKLSYWEGLEQLVAEQAD